MACKTRNDFRYWGLGVASVWLVVLAAMPSVAQSYLEKVQGLRLETLSEQGTAAHYSRGQAGRARMFASFVGRMTAFYAGTHGWRIAPTLAVLNESDWKATFENPYGVPGVRYPGPVAFMPAEVAAGAVYRDSLALRSRVTPELNAEIAASCGSLERCAADGADAIIAHELGHLYELPAGFGRPNIWAGELFADYVAYAYLHGQEAPQRSAFLILHRLTATEPPQFRSLDEFEREISSAEPKELARLHGLIMQRVRQVYERQGLGLATICLPHQWKCARIGQIPSMRLMRTWIG